MKDNLNLKTNLTYNKIEDYKLFDYEIPEISLNFVIENNKVIVKTKLKCIKKNKDSRVLVLNGKNIFIKNVYLDEIILDKTSYLKQKNSLLIKNINKEFFSLEIEGIIKPKENTSLLGR